MWCGLNCYLDKVVNGLKVEKIIVRYVDTNAKVEASVSPVNDLEASKFDEICVLGISNCK